MHIDEIISRHQTAAKYAEELGELLNADVIIRAEEMNRDPILGVATYYSIVIEADEDNTEQGRDLFYRKDYLDIVEVTAALCEMLIGAKLAKGVEV